MRQDLQSKAQVPSTVVPSVSTIKFGSFNINGLDFESSWAVDVEELLKSRGFDVGVFLLSNSTILNNQIKTRRHFPQ